MKYEKLIQELREAADNSTGEETLSELARIAADEIEKLTDTMLHESCTDCPLYDKVNHKCPRFNAVIPRVIKEIQDNKEKENE